MNRTLFAGLLAVALAVSPAYAAKKSVRAKAAHKPAKRAAVNYEDLVWGGSATPKKKVTKKPSTKKKDDLKATVQLSPKTKKPTVATKPAEPAKTEPDKPTVTVAAVDANGKSAEELEKAAKASKDPNQALATYNKLLENDPNYAYSGDVYKDMYRLSQRNGADTLTQLTYAGKAAQALQNGRSRTPVNPKDLQNLNKATDDLINRWIEEETRKILNESGKR